MRNRKLNAGEKVEADKYRKLGQTMKERLSSAVDVTADLVALNKLLEDTVKHMGEHSFFVEPIYIIQGRMSKINLLLAQAQVEADQLNGFLDALDIPEDFTLEERNAAVKFLARRLPYKEGE